MSDNFWHVNQGTRDAAGIRGAAAAPDMARMSTRLALWVGALPFCQIERNHLCFSPLKD
jgi:hypothetical protein